MALTFLTILPLPSRRLAAAADLAAAMAWFPTVGLVLGGMLTLTAAILQERLPPAAAAALLVAMFSFLTRALHLDGLADTLDGLGGGRTKEDTLRIMKDHAVGAFGAVGIAAILLMKYGLLVVVLTQRTWEILLIFPVLSRFAIVLLAYLSPYARPEGGLGQAMTDLATGRTLAWAAASTLLIVGLAGRSVGLLVFLLITALTWGLAAYFRRRLGGVTGDVCGAVNEFSEVAAILFLCLCQ
ncbi:MAG: adenosylcobinamide-GDP ribazoletransferase [Desulfobacca sp.]